MLIEIGNLIATAKRRVFPNRDAFLNILHKLREKERTIKNTERSIEYQKQWLNEIKAETTDQNELNAIETLFKIINS